MDASSSSPAILLVDDDQATLLLLKYSLHKKAPAYTVLTAEDGQRALLYLDERPIPLLITDYLLPDMDGLQLVAAAKAAAPQTYVVLISADISPALAQKAQAAGVD
jgi:CheY-like chemotaxis protein